MKALEEYITKKDKQILQEKNISYDKNILLKLKNPKVALFISVICGNLGIDRFYKGNIIFGVLKLLISIVYMYYFTGLFAYIINSIDLNEVLENTYQALINAYEKAPQDLVFNHLLVGILMGIVWIFDIFYIYYGVKKDNYKKILKSIS